LYNFLLQDFREQPTSTTMVGSNHA